MRLILRLLAALVFVAAAMVATTGSPAPALAGNPDAVCDCKEGYGACQHFLHAPWGATADPCYCDRCREYSQHDGKTVPEGMNAQCFTSARSDCYLKRHAMAWRLGCSECAKKDKCCPLEKSQNCPDCESDSNPIANDALGNPMKEFALKRLDAESKFFKKPDDVTVIYNKHFYLVIDVGGVKVKMMGGGAKVFTAHEYAHLMIERAEMARKEFVRAFGEPSMSKPLGIYLCERERDSQNIAAQYLRGPRANVLKGGGGADVSNGICWSGVVDNAQKAQPDEMLHFSMRHLIGHALISNWPTTDPSAKALPIWIDEGISHWLARCEDRFRDLVVWCANEGTPLSGSGKGWDSDVSKYAAGGKIDPIEKLMGKTAVGQLTIDDHKRCWSYFDVFLREWKEPFVKLIADLRRMKEPRDAFMANVQCTPEIFDERWRERVTGRRKSVSPDGTEGTPEDNDSPSARERRSILSETEPAMIAAKVRALGTVDDPKTVDVLLDLFSRNSELVRETCFVSLCKMKEAECLERIWNYGLVHKEGMVRAYAARACGKLELEFAKQKLRAQIAGDTHWLARAEASIALAILKDADSMSVMRKMVNGDPAEKSQLAAMDSLGMFGEDAQMSVPLILKQLESGQWQLRIGACQSLAKIGSMEAVETLVTRMEQEQGRVREEIRDALKAITYDDLGMKPENWRKWWDREKANTPGGGLPKRPNKPKPEVAGGPGAPKKVDPNERYGEVPKYYGIELYSSRIGFILDTSLSMAQRFEPDSSASSALSHTYTGHDKLSICKEEIAQSLTTLDPRAHFSVIVFNTRVQAYKKNPIPASAGNVAGATAWIKGLPPAGETNYYDGLRAALDLDESPDDLPDFRRTPDTITFLTDGSPTQGEITDRDTLLEWYTSLNRYSRIRTHVICFGTTDVDVVLLRGMAERNGGKFVQVAGKQ
ncbi:MAG: HEAT repeat domain-containing protein [Planctomycetes bacterium]|nr:HEAT repeat domain-containing protein [Planctomycetota bacterium]